MDTHPTLPQDLWDQQQVRCPQGHLSMAWWEHGGGQGSRPIIVEFDKHTCETCPVRPSCTRAKHTGRRLRLPPQDQYEALHEAQTWSASEEGQQLYKRRAGVEGTLSQGVRAFGLRRTRYWGEAKTHLQHVAIAAAMGIHLRRDTLCPQSLSTATSFRCRDRGKSPMWDNTVSKRSGNGRLKNRIAGVVPSVARPSKLCSTAHTLYRFLGKPR
jgi:hypothetical protein